MTADIEQLAINTIRTLSIDAVQAANSGHPGTPMALAPVAYTLWQKFLRFDPTEPIWPNRDRFVLSNGHASMLLYSILHLADVKSVDSSYEVGGTPAVSLDDIKKFRQLGSKCPGHPEYHLTTGVEVTTGPLGQGVATSVGMAMAMRWLATYFNRPGFEIFNYNVYAICGDGDMMEGLSNEAASLAAHHRLHNLCWVYDNNHITIEGKTSLTFSDDVATRFIGYGWNVTRVGDANDTAMLERAFNVFKETTDRPTLIIVDSHIGYGSPHKHDSKEAHGEALGEDEVKLTKKAYGWPEDAKFLVPPGVHEVFAENVGKRGTELRKAWEQKLAAYRKEFAALAETLEQMQKRELPPGWDRALPTFSADAKGLATRDSSAQVLNVLAANLPWLMGGAADLAPSTKTHLNDSGDFSPEQPGARNFHFGIRENAMAAACNGLALSKLRPFGSTFLIFSDYLKPAMRLSAIMELPVVYVFTHDSIGVGEDGPTHQPIEQLSTIRATPGLIDFRPADANEVVEGWRAIMALKHEPAAMVLTRQAVPTIDRTKYAAATGAQKGAYVLADAPDAKVILIGTGSEVSLCLAAHEQLKKEGIAARVVSMPSWKLFEKQSLEYRQSVLPPALKARVAVEQAATLGWERYAETIVGMTTFGASAPLKALQSKFGFTVEHVVKCAKEAIA